VVVATLSIGVFSFTEARWRTLRRHAPAASALSTMFKRFVLTELGSQSGRRAGIFQAPHELSRSATISKGSTEMR
jgi:hypothetical protein